MGLEKAVHAYKWRYEYENSNYGDYARMNEEGEKGPWREDPGG